MTVIVNCSALNDNEFTGTPEEYMEQFAGFVSESEIKDFTAVDDHHHTVLCHIGIEIPSFPTGIVIKRAQSCIAFI